MEIKSLAVPTAEENGDVEAGNLANVSPHPGFQPKYSVSTLPQKRPEG